MSDATIDAPAASAFALAPSPALATTAATAIGVPQVAPPTLPGPADGYHLSARHYLTSYEAHPDMPAYAGVEAHPRDLAALGLEWAVVITGAAAGAGVIVRRCQRCAPCGFLRNV